MTKEEQIDYILEQHHINYPNGSGGYNLSSYLNNLDDEKFDRIIKGLKMNIRTREINKLLKSRIIE